MREMTQNATVIVAHAQHPLEGGVYPNEDFRARLDEAAMVSEKHNGLPLVYVPGSLHKGDERSLSDAGVEYLLAKGLPSEALRGEQWNNYYRNPQGVCCGADEVEVAVRGLTEIASHEQTGRRMIAICALGQAARLKLHYDGFGLSISELEAITVGSDALHRGVSERLLTLYTRLDPQWRGSLPEIIRSSRRPSGHLPRQAPQAA